MSHEEIHDLAVAYASSKLNEYQIDCRDAILDGNTDMSIEEIIHVLERIKRGYLPQDYMYYNGTEEDYENTKLHIAMSKAIKILKEKGGLE